MKTAALTKLHNRCIIILEMISDANKHEQEAQSFLKYQLSLPYIKQNDYSISHYTKQVPRFKAIKERLIKYYWEVYERLLKVAEPPKEIIGELRLTPEQEAAALLEMDEIARKKEYTTY